MSARAKTQWPTLSGWYLVENTVRESERLDRGKGTQTIRRVEYLKVIPDRPDLPSYENGDYWRGEWVQPGCYVERDGHLMAPERAFDGWEDLRLLYLDLDFIASAHDAVNQA